MPLHILIIGSGPAGLAAAEAAKQQDPTSKVTILSRDSHLPYSRIRLFEVVAEPASLEKLYLHPASWYVEKGIDLLLNTEVAKVLPAEHQVLLTDGRRIAYDRLILATGSKSFVPPIQGSDLPGIETIWTMEEALGFESRTCTASKAVIVGGGLLGLEAAHALAKKGVSCTIVELMPRMMMRQLDEEAARLFTLQVEQEGITVLTGASTEAFLPGEDGHVKEVLLSDGRRLEADVVFISAGVRAVLDLIDDCEIHVDRCIVADDHMRTNQPDIYTAGDNTLFDGRWYGLWQIASAQGKVAGANAAGADLSYEMPIPPYLVITMGTRIASAGIISDTGSYDAYREDIRSDDQALTYEKLVYDGDDLIGYVMLGDTKRSFALQKELKH